MALFPVVNLLSVRSYGEAEFWFASIKVAAIVVFLVAGALFVLGGWPGAHSGLPHLTADGGFMPNGLVPVLTGAVAATGFYFGAEIVTIAAAESAEPENELERRVTSQPELLEGLAWGQPRAGHPEGAVGTHVSHLLDTDVLTALAPRHDDVHVRVRARRDPPARIAGATGSEG